MTYSKALRKEFKRVLGTTRPKKLDVPTFIRNKQNKKK